MAYSEKLADRVRAKLSGVKRVTEQDMFGRLTFLVAGNVCCGVEGDDLMVRLRPDLHHDALTRPHVHESGPSGRAVRGTVYVTPEGVAEDGDFELWVNLGLAHAQSLPPKKARKAKKAAKRATTRKRPAAR